MSMDGILTPIIEVSVGILLVATVGAVALQQLGLANLSTLDATETALFGVVTIISIIAFVLILLKGAVRNK